MKNKDFLIKIFGEGKIELVEPSENIKDSYIEKSESNLISAKILLENNRLEEAMSLSYYSMYHLLTALLFKIGIKCENHSASIILLKELFEIDNTDIFSAKKERIDKRYYTDFKITKQDIIESIGVAESFNKGLINFISKLNNQNIKGYREKLKIILG
jgi:uncharacterized protein (UPF0332 family)